MIELESSDSLPPGGVPIIESRGITKSYDDVVALNDVTFTIPKGSCTGVVGPNGAGKTTLLEIIQGIRKSDHGEVFIFGERQGLGKSFASDRIGIASQSFSLSPLLKVRELFELYSLLYSKAWSPTELIRRVNLSDKAESKFGRLSGGQKKRVSVALALVGHPELLILDEPTGELDPQARRAIWDLIRMGETPRTTLIATHQMEEAEALCDQIIIMDKGRIIDLGSPDFLIQKYCPDYRLRFDAKWDFDLSALGLNQDLMKLNSISSVHKSVEIILENVDEAYRTMSRVREVGGNSITGLGIQRMTLDDVFIKVTGDTELI